MVELDQSEIELQWECPPCAVTRPPLPSPRLTPVCPNMRRTSATNGLTKQKGVNEVPGRLSFQDARIRDLPFYPVKATLLRPSSLTQKDKDSQVSPPPNFSFTISLNLKLFQEQQNQSLAFYLTPEQASIVSNGRVVQNNGMVVYKMHILLRFTKLSADGIQDDDFPKNLILKINNKVRTRNGNPSPSLLLLASASKSFDQ